MAVYTVTGGVSGITESNQPAWIRHWILVLYTFNGVYWISTSAPSSNNFNFIPVNNVQRYCSPHDDDFVNAIAQEWRVHYRGTQQATRSHGLHANPGLPISRVGPKPKATWKQTKLAAKMTANKQSTLCLFQASLRKILPPPKKNISHRRSGMQLRRVC